MKRKFCGIKIGTILSAILCLIAAVIFWFFVQYSRIDTHEAQTLVKALTYNVL